MFGFILGVSWKVFRGMYWEIVIYVWFYFENMFWNVIMRMFRNIFRTEKIVFGWKCIGECVVVFDFVSLSSLIILLVSTISLPYFPLGIKFLLTHFANQ